MGTKSADKPNGEATGEGDCTRAPSRSAAPALFPCGLSVELPPAAALALAEPPAAPPVHGDALELATESSAEPAPALLALYERAAVLYEAAPPAARPELHELATVLEDAILAGDRPAALAILAAVRAVARVATRGAPGLYRVTARGFVAGFVVRAGYVVRAAPVIRRAVQGRSLPEALHALRAHHVERVPPAARSDRKAAA